MMIEVYGKPNCKYCDMAKALLTNKGVEYSYIDIMQDEDAMDMIVDAGLKSVPQIFNGDTHIGGYEDLVKYLEDYIEPESILMQLTLEDLITLCKGVTPDYDFMDDPMCKRQGTFAASYGRWDWNYNAFKEESIDSLLSFYKRSKGE